MRVRDRRRMPLGILLLATALAVGPLAAPPASATFPGTVGGILFVSTRDGNDEIYKMNADGTNQIRLTDNPATDGGPNASPDGRKIAFHSNRDGDYDIYTMNLDGSGLFQITNNPGVDVLPAFSPDGTKIAFQSTRTDSKDVESRAAFQQGNDFDIWTVLAGGSNPSQATNNPAFDYEPVWSPNGNFIMFTSDRDGNENLYGTSPNGTDIFQLTEDPADDFAGDISPDGTFIYWSSNRGDRYNIWRAEWACSDSPSTCTLDANATSVTDRDAPISHPAVAPNGQMGVAEGQRTGGSDFQIHFWDVTNPGAPRLLTTQATNHEPAWFYAPPPNWGRNITINFRHGAGNKLVVFGNLSVTNGTVDECTSEVPVNIQQRAGGRWRTRKTPRTSQRGRYAVEIFDRASRYRALAQPRRFLDEGYELNICEETLKAEAHRHP